MNAGSLRLFVALNLETALREWLVEAARPLFDSAYPVRWVAPENIHLTLKFLGNVDERRLPDIMSATERAVQGAATFEMVLAGFGAFPSTRRPRVIWVGVEPNPALEKLQGRLVRGLDELGFPREARAFHPHLTLGRARKRASAGQLKGIDDLLQRLQYRDTSAVRSVDVMRSRLRQAGAVYDIVHSSALES